MIPSLLVFGSYGLLALRIVLGGILIARGWPKLSHLTLAADQLRASGFRPARVWAALFAGVEFVGGLCIFAGLFAQIAGLAVALFSLIGFIWRPAGGRFTVRGRELDALIFVACLVVATIGAGNMSLDGTFRVLLY